MIYSNAVTSTCKFGLLEKFIIYFIFYKFIYIKPIFLNTLKIFLTELTGIQNLFFHQYEVYTVICKCFWKLTMTFQTFMYCRNVDVRISKISIEYLKHNVK